MRCGKFVALLLLVTLLGPATAADAKSDLADNAALKYWQAFALMPPMDKNQQKIVEEWNKAPLDKAARQLIERSQASLAELHRAAKMQRCDWGLELKDGYRLLLPHCPKARTLARLAGLHARLEFEQGHWRSAWQDVNSLFHLARHVGMGPTLINRLVGYGIETMAIDVAAPHLPELKSVLPANAAAELDKLPAEPSLSQMVRYEKQIGASWLIQELKKAERHKVGSWRDIWNEIFSLPEDANRKEIPSVENFKQAVTLLGGTLPYYDQLAKMMALSPNQFDAQYPRFLKKAKAANPLAGYLLPGLDKFSPMDRRMEARLAMFKAALVIVQNGPAKLKDIKDPFGDGPFAYRALGKGFELKSKLRFKGKPVTLMVGKGNQE